MSYVLAHTTVAIDVKTVLAAILLIGFTVFFIYRNRKMKKEESDLEQELKAQS